MRNKLGRSAAKDLLALVVKFEQRVEDSNYDAVGPNQGATVDAEQAMRRLLQLSEARWIVVLEQARC